MKKLLKQFGTYGNEYSLDEVGDAVNELIMKVDPETNIEEEIIDPLPEPMFANTEGDLAVRSPASQDRVYLIREGKKHWIKNPETLEKLGFTFHTIANITNEELDNYETDDPIDLREDLPVEGDVPDESSKYNL